MARGFRRYGRRRKNYPKRKRYANPYLRKGIKGSKFRLRMKGKMRSNKWQKYTFFDNIHPAHNVSGENTIPLIAGTATTGMMFSPVSAVAFAAGPNVPNGYYPFDQEARTAWFGAAYAAGGGVLDATQNPTTIGNGMLNWINGKDPMMDFRRWDYSAWQLTREKIVDAWNRTNNVAGAIVRVPINQVFVKGVKINVLGRNTNMPGIMYMIQNKNDQAIKIREQISKIKGYYATKKIQAPVAVGPIGAAVNVHWDVPDITIGGPTFSRIRVTAYYKLRAFTVN